MSKFRIENYLLDYITLSIIHIPDIDTLFSYALTDDSKSELISELPCSHIYHHALTSNDLNEISEVPGSHIVHIDILY